ncbi:MAG TPA: glycosyltransferase [Phycisphaerales bacterium]|nr:glycosyltransferase [Phycisphaerales bacterium]
MWAQENIAKYYVAPPAVKQDLQKFGVDAHKVSVTGIPIKQDFASQAQSPGEARKALGLDPEKPLVLMLGGSLGYGSFSESLSAMDSTEGNFQMAAITGKNENLRRELEALETNKNLHLEGYVTNMPTWIDAADLVVTKPGGLTCSEILAKGKPMILQNAESGLEGRLVRRLEESGVALVVDGAEDMARTVSELIKEPQKLDALKAKARAVGKPTSSDEIADSILRSIRSAS